MPMAPLSFHLVPFDTTYIRLTWPIPTLRIASGVSPLHLKQNKIAGPEKTRASEGSFQFPWSTNGTMYYCLFFSHGYVAILQIPPKEDCLHLVRNTKSWFAGRSHLRMVSSTERNQLSEQWRYVDLNQYDDLYAPGGQGLYFDPNESSVVKYYHYGENILFYLYLPNALT